MARDEDETTRPAAPRERGPGRLTMAEMRLDEVTTKLEDDQDDSVVEVAKVNAEIRKSLLNAAIEFGKSGNFRWLLAALVAVLLGPIVIVGTWAIDGGIKVDGWGCYGTANFCEVQPKPRAEP